MILFLEPLAALSIQLRSPEFSDSLDINTNVLVHTAMDGSVRTYRADPATKKMSLTFINLTRTKAMELRNFIIQTNGKEVLYTDVDQVTWRGHILTHPLEIVTDGRGPGKDTDRRESNTVTLEFEGTNV